MHSQNSLQPCTEVSLEHLHSRSKAQVTEFFLIKNITAILEGSPGIFTPISKTRRP